MAVENRGSLGCSAVYAVSGGASMSSRRRGLERRSLPGGNRWFRSAADITRDRKGASHAQPKSKKGSERTGPRGKRRPGKALWKLCNGCTKIANQGGRDR